ncbi:MAG: GNAT family N-acetyltransferase [Thermomicrobiales bacterium]
MVGADGAGGVDPALWFLAWDGDEVAGVALNYVAPATGIGWVDHLGVRRLWRRTGLGMALLRHSFASFRARRPRCG